MGGTRHDVTDEEWNILQQALPRERQGPRRLQDRRVMDGIFAFLRTGSPWRKLPAGALRSLHHLLPPLQPLEQEWGLVGDSRAYSRCYG